MPDAIDHLKIMNNALARIAGGSISGEDDDSDLAEQVIAVYYDRLDATLGMHEWSFAGKTYKLDALAQTADNDYDAAAQKFINGWRYAFALPGTRIGEPRKVLRDPRNPKDPLRDFLIEAGTLYCDCEQVWAVVTVRVDPASWPPLFRLAITTLAAAELCVPVTHDSNLAATLFAQGHGTPDENGRGGALGRAIAADVAKSRTATPMWSDPLTAARLT